MFLSDSLLNAFVVPFFIVSAYILCCCTKCTKCTISDNKYNTC